MAGFRRHGHPRSFRFHQNHIALNKKNLHLSDWFSTPPDNYSIYSVNWGNIDNNALSAGTYYYSLTYFPIYNYNKDTSNIGCTIIDSISVQLYTIFKYIAIIIGQFLNTTGF